MSVETLGKCRNACCEMMNTLTSYSAAPLMVDLLDQNETVKFYQILKESLGQFRVVNELM